MAKSRIVVPAFLFMFLASGRLSGIEFSFSVLPRYETGGTSYHIDIQEFNTSYGENVKVESRLEYPFSHLHIEFSGNMTIGMVSLNGFLGRNLIDPVSKMIDSDWIGIPAWKYRDLFSYTESRAELTGIIYGLGLSLNLSRSRDSRFDLQSGMVGTFFEYSMFGLTGWQDDGTTLARFDGNDSVKVLYYRVRWYGAFLGAEWQLIMPFGSDLQLGFRFYPWVHARDFDDHPLRNKKSFTKAYGVGVDGTAQLNVRVDKSVYFIVGCVFSWWRAEGDQNQIFYGDDPGTTDDETGLEFEGIHNVLQLIRFSTTIGIQVRL